PELSALRLYGERTVPAAGKALSSTPSSHVDGTIEAGPAKRQLARRSLSGTSADTEIVGPPQAVKVSATVKLVVTSGKVTSIELTTGQVCSPLEGTSLDSTMKPTSATPPGESVSVVGAIP